MSTLIMPVDTQAPRSGREGILRADGTLAPSSYRVDANGCHVWLSSVGNGKPRARLRGKWVSVRRWLLHAAPDEQARIREDCDPLCVNPAHMTLYRAKGSVSNPSPPKPSVLRGDGTIDPSAYEETPDGCRLWLGYCERGRPRGTFNGRSVSVARWVLQMAGINVPEQAKITATCGHGRCVRRAHLMLKKWRRIPKA